MSSATSAQPAFSNEEVAQLLELLKGADSVELKLTVPEAEQRSTVAALDLDPLEAQIRQVYFFDTPELDLDAHGVVARARRIQGKGGDSIVKLRPVVPSELPEELRMSGGFRVEVDVLPGGFVCSGALKGSPDSADVRNAAKGTLPLRKLFSKEQRQLFAAHAPQGIALDDLAVLGPIFVLKLRTLPPELDRKLVAEMWIYPDGSRILELSTRAATNEAFQVAAETRAFLTSRGVDLSGEQETKTRKALEYFAKAHKQRRERRRHRPALGVAHVRRELRRGRNPAHPERGRAGAGERRGLSPVRGKRRLGQGARRPDGREAARGRRRQRARAVAARAEGVLPARRRRRRAPARRARRVRPGARARDVHARAARRRARAAESRPRGRRRAQAAASTTDSAAAWRSCRRSRPPSRRHARSPSRRRIPRS